MSQQGENPEPGEKDDWWSQLYDPEALDTGASGSEDTLDDRFASALRTVGGGPSVPGPRKEPGHTEGPPSGLKTAHPSPAAPPRHRPEPALQPSADPAALSELVPDTALDGAEHGAVTFRAVSLRGRDGGARGEPRREALLSAGFGEGRSGLLLLAVASAGRRTPGARRAARELCHAVGEAVGRSHARLADDLRAARRGALKPGLNRLTDRVYGKLRAQAAALGLAPEEYTAGVRCLLVPADPRCGTRVFFGVGDGGLFRLRGGAWRDIAPSVAAPAAQAPVASPPPVLPAGGPWPQQKPVAAPPPFLFRATEAAPGDVLLMCTEGFAASLRSGPFMAGRLAESWGEPSGPPDLVAFLDGVRTRSSGEHGDDRTAVAVWER